MRSSLNLFCIENCFTPWLRCICLSRHLKYIERKNSFRGAFFLYFIKENRLNSANLVVPFTIWCRKWKKQTHKMRHVPIDIQAREDKMPWINGFIRWNKFTGSYFDEIMSKGLQKNPIRTTSNSSIYQSKKANNWNELQMCCLFRKSFLKWEKKIIKCNLFSVFVFIWQVYVDLIWIVDANLGKLKPNLVSMPVINGIAAR